jgi:hypothetical protein
MSKAFRDLGFKIDDKKLSALRGNKNQRWLFAELSPAHEGVIESFAS